MAGRKTPEGERKAVAAAAAGLFLLGFLVYAWFQRSLLTGVAGLFR